MWPCQEQGGSWLLICSLWTQATGLSCPPRSGLKPWAGMANFPGSLLMTGQTSCCLQHFMLSPGTTFHKRKNLPDWLSSHFPQPHTLPRLGPMSYFWRRLGSEQGQQTCICPCWVCLQVGKSKWTDSFFICSVYDHFRGLTLEWQVFRIRKYWENWQDDSFFKMALNTGTNRTHPQDLRQDLAGWDDAQGREKEGMSCSKQEEGCSAHPEMFLCCAMIGIPVGSINRQLWSLLLLSRTKLPLHPFTVFGRFNFNCVLVHFKTNVSAALWSHKSLQLKPI